MAISKDTNVWPSIVFWYLTVVNTLFQYSMFWSVLRKYWGLILNPFLVSSTIISTRFDLISLYQNIIFYNIYNSFHQTTKEILQTHLFCCLVKYKAGFRILKPCDIGQNTMYKKHKIKWGMLRMGLGIGFIIYKWAPSNPLLFKCCWFYLIIKVFLIQCQWICL